MFIRIVKLTAILLIIFCFQRTLIADDLKTAKSLYEKGTKNYDIKTLNKALNLLAEIPEEKQYEYLLQQGIILQRIHFIYYVEGNKKKSKEFGNRSLEVLSKALKHKPKSLEAIAYRGMIYQIFSDFGWRSAAKFGPKSKEVLDLVKKMNSKHFLSRFMDATNSLKAPKFVGGDKQKGLESFKSLRKDYPNNEDIWVYLAFAYFENKKYQDAFEILRKVLEKNPRNLFAKNLKQEIRKELK